MFLGDKGPGCTKVMAVCVHMPHEGKCSVRARRLLLGCLPFGSTMVIKFKAHEVCLPSMLQGLAQVTPWDGQISFGVRFPSHPESRRRFGQRRLFGSRGWAFSFSAFPAKASVTLWCRALERTQAY